MLNDTNKNFLMFKRLFDFLSDPDILTEEEAKQDLIEDGVNFEEIERKVEQYLKKLKARELILKGKLKKAEFEKNLDEFENSSNNFSKESNYNYGLAARKGTVDEIKNNDEELFNFIKKKENKSD